MFDQSIVCYVLGHSNNNGLVLNTIKPAIRRLAEDECPILQSDRFFQYTSKQFKQIIQEAKIVHSMSRVGRCSDNGPNEACWGTLKVVKYYL
ncbi:DDE-type integrase/transposase/recombinase [Lysinibacillus fusiformis]|uniref:DDE-type integrase/transposase/recombinase n=1 Tax=Lysinibacillus fusiformis TaxID=28031 RepID=UPI0019670BD7|nr:DDE-type integrase/transposase/recombinase [Lysinibacillus fusiformis]QSB07876.1 transposase family protein [Lysinibacillus fusiformis]